MLVNTVSACARKTVYIYGTSVWKGIDCNHALNIPHRHSKPFYIKLFIIIDFMSQDCFPASIYSQKLMFYAVLRILYISIFKHKHDKYVKISI